ncbi:hypothetical protein, partial [Pseudomonas aeruginosa]
MLTGIPFVAMTIIMAAIAFSYSQYSGIRASMLTDAIQMVGMLIVSIAFLVFGIRNGGGLENLQAGLKGINGIGGSLVSQNGIEFFLGF